MQLFFLEWIKRKKSVRFVVRFFSKFSKLWSESNLMLTYAPFERFYIIILVAAEIVYFQVWLCYLWKIWWIITQF
jgi:hypothetical protein